MKTVKDIAKALKTEKSQMERMSFISANTKAILAVGMPTTRQGVINLFRDEADYSIDPMLAAQIADEVVKTLPKKKAA